VPRLHFRIDYTDDGRRVAVCSCGWQSDARNDLSSSGGAWELHFEAEHAERRKLRFTVPPSMRRRFTDGVQR